MKLITKTLAALVLGFGLSHSASAQSGTISAQNADAVKNYDGTMGRFNYALNEREQVNVNYAITPKYPTNVAHFMIHTPDPMPFSATVTDASGKTVYSWKPEQKVYLYNADWNIAALGAGTYTVNVFMGTEPKSIYQFEFSKK